VAGKTLGRRLVEMLFIVVLGVASVAVLLAAQRYAAPAVKRFQEMRLRSSILAAAGVSHTPADASATFEERVREVESGGAKFYVVDSLVVYEFKGRGLWGPVEGVITVDSSFERISGVRILVQEETPGLGDRIAAPDYLVTYRGKTAVRPLELAMHHAATADDEVDAISGATLSSQALLVMVNDAVARLRAATGK
jgi:Na+-transporting NADH:ubiquinone oxidoreductase subunit C